MTDFAFQANAQAEQELARKKELASQYLKAMNPALRQASIQYRRELGAEELMIWAKAMIQHNVDPAHFSQAMEYHLATGRFFPTPIEIAELVTGQNSGNRALRAMSTLRHEVEAHGPYRQHTIADPVLLQTVEDLGGWKAVNEQFDDSEGFRIRFLNAYRNNQRSTPVIGMSNHLAIDYEDPSAQMSFLPSPGQ